AICQELPNFAAHRRELGELSDRRPGAGQHGGGEHNGRYRHHRSSPERSCRHGNGPAPERHGGSTRTGRKGQRLPVGLARPSGLGRPARPQEEARHPHRRPQRPEERM
ncbi:MAG: hypothetical protein AVDCRST_MAG31-2349, partial [uncultured Sphingomonas sp.]